MFTFSFSTAFAYTWTTSEATLVDNAYNNAVAELGTSYKNLSAALKDTTGTYTTSTSATYGIKLDARALQEVADKVYADYLEVLKVQYTNAKANQSTVATADAAEKLFTTTTIVVDADTNNYLGTYLNGASYSDVKGYDKFSAAVYAQGAGAKYADALMNALLPYTKEFVTAEIAKVDLLAYSDAVVDKNDAFKTTYAQLAKNTVDKMTKEINDIDFTGVALDKKIQTLGHMAILNGAITAIDDEGTVASVAGTDGLGLVSAVLKPADGYKTIDNEFVITKYVIIDDAGKLQTAEALKATDAQNAANVASYKAYVEKNYADKYAEYYTAYAVNKTMTKAEYEAAVKNLDKYRVVALYIIENGTAAQAAMWATPSELNAQLAAAPARYDVVEAVVAKAETFKIVTDKTGELLYDAATIDKNVKAIKMKVYYDADLTIEDSEIIAGADNVVDMFAWNKEVALAKNEAAREVALGDADTYYAPEQAKINALFDKRAEEINACTTSAQIAQTTATAVTVPVTIKTAAAIRADFETALGTSALSAQKGYADNYIKYKNAGKLTNDATLVNITDVKALMAKVYAENGARTNTAAKGLLAEVYAAIDAFPTVGEQTANIQAVKDAIAALPSTITSADKETVRAAQDLYDALTAQEQAAVATTRLTNAKTALQKIDADAITKAIKALPSALKVTVADKAALEAAQALIDAYDDEELYNADWATDALKTRFEALRTAEKDAIVKMIYALGQEPTVAAVEAARAAYDAYVDYWTDAEADYYAADDVANLNALLYAEAQVAEEKEAAKAELIASVEGLKIKANSSAKKGSITVKWTVTGDDSNVEKYQVYKSTKAQKGYKKAITTTKTSFKNTKNLEKGTRYYYKVRAYVTVDGVKYYSDWSNKANRIAK